MYLIDYLSIIFRLKIDKYLIKMNILRKATTTLRP